MTECGFTNLGVLDLRRDTAGREVRHFGRIAFLEPAQVERSSEIRQAWRQLAVANTHATAIYQSPEWWDHLCSTDAWPRRYLGVIRSEDGSVRRIAFSQVGNHLPRFAVGTWTSKVPALDGRDSSCRFGDGSSGIHAQVLSCELSL